MSKRIIKTAWIIPSFSLCAWIVYDNDNFGFAMQFEIRTKCGSYCVSHQIIFHSKCISVTKINTIIHFNCRNYHWIPCQMHIKKEILNQSHSGGVSVFYLSLLPSHCCLQMKSWLNCCESLYMIYVIHIAFL